MNTQVTFAIVQILRKMDKACIAVFQDIVYQFLYDAEYDQFFFRQHSFPVVVEAATGIHPSRAANLLEEVVYCGFQAEILKGWRHQAMRDITDKLDRIVNDLFCIIYALE